MSEISDLIKAQQARGGTVLTPRGEFDRRLVDAVAYVQATGVPVLAKGSDDQPRDDDGRFASGNGGGGGGKSMTYAEAKAAAAAAKPAGTHGAGGAPTQPVTVREAQTPDFVHSFMREHNTTDAMNAALKTRDTEKLKTALRLTENHHTAATQHFRSLVAAELKARG